MAYSLRLYSNLPIQLVTEQKLINLVDSSLFDTITIISREDSYQGTKCFPGYAKIRLYDYIIFDEYIYLDVDGLLLKPIEPLLEECRNLDKDFISIQVGEGKSTEEKYPNMIWAFPKDMWEKYNLPKDRVMPFLNSSFQYVRKGKIKRLFETAQEMIEDPIPVDKLRAQWGRSQPDELYMNMALCKLGIDPKLAQPTYPIYFERHRLRKDVLEEFYILGLYGDKTHTHKSVLQYYDIKLTDICNALGVERGKLSRHLFHEKFMIKNGK